MKHKMADYSEVLLTLRGYLWGGDDLPRADYDQILHQSLGPGHVSERRRERGRMKGEDLKLTLLYFHQLLLHKLVN